MYLHRNKKYGWKGNLFYNTHEGSLDILSAKRLLDMDLFGQSGFMGSVT
jgi:hypothetical protein